MRHRNLLVLFFVSLVVAGCGSSGPRVVKVKGTVTHAGKPVNKLFLNFVPEQGRPSWGITDKDGNYTLNYDRGHEGATVGMHRVWVQVPPSSPAEEQKLAQNTLERPPEIKAILDKYGKEQTTPLKVEVKEDNQVINLQLD